LHIANINFIPFSGRIRGNYNTVTGDMSDLRGRSGVRVTR
jgi:hypothetical protein